jgi:hypothetical protein
VAINYTAEYTTHSIINRDTLIQFILFRVSPRARSVTYYLYNSGAHQLHALLCAVTGSQTQRNRVSYTYVMDCSQIFKHLLLNGNINNTNSSTSSSLSTSTVDDAAAAVYEWCTPWPSFTSTNDSHCVNSLL